MGKSHVAKQLYSSFKQPRPRSNQHKGRVSLTNAGLTSHSLEIPPSWWFEWTRARNPRRAVWIIDALDEAADQSNQALDSIVQALYNLKNKQILNLRLALFSREHQGLADFRSKLLELYRSHCGTTLKEYELGRLDRTQAEELIGGADFPKVLAIIKNNRLNSIAGFPVILNLLRKYSPNIQLTQGELWKDVLKGLLGSATVGTGALRRFQSEIEDRFEAASRIAIALSLCGNDSLHEDSIGAQDLKIVSLFPSG
jgi:hypothetical protein